MKTKEIDCTSLQRQLLSPNGTYPYEKYNLSLKYINKELMKGLRGYMSNFNVRERRLK